MWAFWSNLRGCPQAEKWDQVFRGCGVSPRDIPPQGGQSWDQKALCPRASKREQRSSVGGQRQPSGSGRTKDVGQPLLRGSESTREVWPVSGPLGPEGEDKLPHWMVARRPGDSQTWGLTEGLQEL